MTSCFQKPNNQAKNLHVETKPFHFGCMKSKALKKYSAGSPSADHDSTSVQAAFCVAVFPVFCRNPQRQGAYRHELKLKAGGQAGQQEQEEEGAEGRRLTLAMQLNFSAFQLQAPHLVHFSHLFFFLPSLMRQLYLAIIVHLFEKFLLCCKPTSQNNFFQLQLQLQHQEKIQTCYLSPSSFIKCARKGNTGCLGCQLFLQVVFWEIICETFFSAL